MKTTKYSQTYLKNRKLQYERAKKQKKPRRCSFCSAIVPKRRIYCKRTFCNNECKAEWQQTSKEHRKTVLKHCKQLKPVTKAWLEQKYLVEFLDSRDIAKLVNRAPATVVGWFKQLKIPMRKCGINPHKKKPVRKRTAEERQHMREVRLRDGHVPYLKNGVHWLKGKRGPEVPSWKGGVTPTRQKLYSTNEWKRAVHNAWVRDRGFCQRCERHYLDDRDLSFDLHHIVPFEYEPLRTKVRNLVLLCEKCHYWVHGPENVDREFIKEIPK
jgi:hypothetical protein